MALSNVVKIASDAGTYVLADGTGTPLTHTVKFDSADLTISGIQQALKETKAYQSRGKFVSLRKGQRAPVQFSFSYMQSDLSESSSGTTLDFIFGKGAHSARVTTGRIGGDVVTLDFTVTFEGTSYGDSADQTIKMQDCEFSVTVTEGDPNSIKLDAVCYGDVYINGSNWFDVN
jgi:hypothetical protein